LSNGRHSCLLLGTCRYNLQDSPLTGFPRFRIFDQPAKFLAARGRDFFERVQHASFHSEGPSGRRMAACCAPPCPVQAESALPALPQLPSPSRTRSSRRTFGSWAAPSRDLRLSTPKLLIGRVYSRRDLLLLDDARQQLPQYPHFTFAERREQIVFQFPGHVSDLRQHAAASLRQVQTVAPPVFGAVAALDQFQKVRRESCGGTEPCRWRTFGLGRRRSWFSKPTL